MDQNIVILVLVDLNPILIILNVLIVTLVKAQWMEVFVFLVLLELFHQELVNVDVKNVE